MQSLEPASIPRGCKTEIESKPQGNFLKKENSSVQKMKHRALILNGREFKSTF
ncbi:hypothetical protein LEP1GSC060_3429 [Leptospira weilii serovar Ranarum str. ICFT]|uniref:Uncharacterized protein n=1 Tax=Leptospira weilii serovar Ranarum str. ICFT TaxID=1218598 RepID=N1WMI1_9LEPT|nr:hypothetical protein LEP1GSC060_3429 [Leptospira weilii serovar Ranarum str. ICFT]